jgi:capsular polysaccharide export protein
VWLGYADVRRTFLVLQGPATPFFLHLSRRLRTDGHRVVRVHFCAGDVAYGAESGALAYRGRVEGLRDWLDAVYRRYAITDQVLFGDRRPVHRPAVAHGEACGVRTWVFEEGYFRPHWVTLEREGVNGHSLLPRDPDWFREVGSRLPEPSGVVAFRSPFWRRAVHDVLYHLAGVVNPVLFPHYQTHAPYPAPLEYAGYLQRFARLRLIREREVKRAQAIMASGVSYYVLPLQLNSDAQIRDHSRFEDMEEVMDHVVASFARYAPSGSHLVVKNHPLDPGLVNHGRALQAMARDYDVVGRVDYLEEGDLVGLLRHARGCVTVNSTSGILALEQGTPTMTLSDPIYNLPGLTFQGALDAFWQGGVPPDPAFFGCFRRAVIHTTQINGGFYCPAGIRLAVENSVRVLTADRSPLEALL